MTLTPAKAGHRAPQSVRALLAAPNAAPLRLFKIRCSDIEPLKGKYEAVPMEYIIVKTDEKASEVNAHAGDHWMAVGLSTVSGEHYVLMTREARSSEPAIGLSQE